MIARMCVAASVFIPERFNQMCAAVVPEGVLFVIALSVCSSSTLMIPPSESLRLKHSLNK